jgi:hypothetical protein
MSAAAARLAPLARLALPVVAGAAVIATLSWSDRLPQAGVVEATVLLLGASLWLMQRETGLLDLRRMTIPGVWYWTYLAMLLVPSLFVQAQHAGPGRIAFLVGVESLLVTVPLGVWLVNRLSDFRVAEIERFYARDFDEPAAGEREFRWCAGGLVAALLVTAAYLAEVRTVPLFYMLMHPGENVTLVLLREDAFKLLSSPLVPLYYLLRVLGYPLLILVTLGFYLRVRTRRWLLLFLGSLAGGLFFAALAIAKAPVAVIVLLLCLFLFALYARRLSNRVLLLAGLAGSGLMVLFPLTVVLLISAGSGVSAGIALLALGRRLFYLPSEVVYWYFTLFPGNVGFLHGRTIGKLAWLLGWPYFNAPNYVGLYGLGTWIESVNANGAFIGTLHADFGFAGVVLGGVAAGALMQWQQVRVARGRKTVLALAAYAYLIFGFWLLHSTSLPIVLATNGVGLVIVAPWLWRLSVPLLAAWKRRGEPPPVRP